MRTEYIVDIKSSYNDHEFDGENYNECKCGRFLSFKSDREALQSAKRQKVMCPKDYSIRCEIYIEEIKL